MVEIAQKALIIFYFIQTQSFLIIHQSLPARLTDIHNLYSPSVHSQIISRQKNPLTGILTPQSEDSLFSIILLRFIILYILCFFASKNVFVSFTITPLSANSAIIFGIAISPLKISAIVHTALTVIYGPINTARM